jgi:hypothetical protein
MNHPAFTGAPALALLLLVACGGGGTGTTGAGGAGGSGGDPNLPDASVTGGWPAVKLLMDSKCATSLCHNADTKAAKLDLTPTSAVFNVNVVNAASSQVPAALRVAPGKPKASYLLCKVDPTCTDKAMNTAGMPLGLPVLSDSEIKMVSEWILNGAPTE